MGADGARPNTGDVARDALGRIYVEDGLGRMERGCARSAVSGAPVQTGRVGRAREKRIHRDVPGVVQCGVGPDFIDYDVQLRTDNGEMRVGVRLARMLLEDSQFVSWSAPELALLWFLQCGVPPELGLRTGTRWCDCANLHGAGPIARMLAQLTGRHRSRVDVALAMHGLQTCTRSAKSSARSHLLPGSMVRVLPCIDVCDTGGAVDSTHTDDDAGGMPPERPVSELLMATALPRAAHAASDAAFARQEAV